ncbi:SIMPL domain-containing protein [Venatoribacter cucullus]|uniref:DUF541 domain-containing protein n=1 Tax=Venatoribacter cucullus TaxID=2661630 RepID=A0A9E8FID9_9GAMM|nr:SIMPL domain-containing protein [Venatoribacter cucullus]QQD23254.1 DUF541 domain-containing protein [Venatoribacter cucullus]UZK02686.1 DUF541 domain-containing protein [Venatoribacter cucullus]
MLLPRSASPFYALFLFILLLSPAAWADRYISVSGQGEVEEWPDYLRLQLEISAVERSASDAKKTVDAAMQELLALTKHMNIAADDIDASRISNQPVYDWDNNRRVLRGEQVSRPVTITLRDLNQYTDLVHHLLQNPLLQLQHSQPGFNDPQQLYLRAAALALENARQKAEHMASALGNRLGKTERIEEQGGMPAPAAEMRLLSMAKADAAPAPMLVQKQRIRATVQVRFELK